MIKESMVYSSKIIGSGDFSSTQVRLKPSLPNKGVELDPLTYKGNT